MEQRTNMQPFVAPKPRPKVGGKPAIAAKPSHLKKEPSFDKSATGVNKNLAKQPSLNHMTPKVWVKAPLVRENEHKPVHQDPPQRKVPPSPFGSSVWRPVHQMHTKPAVEKKLSNGSTQKPEIVPPTLVETREDEKFPEDDTKTLTGEIDKKEEFSKPSNLKLRPTLSGPRTPIPYRPSMRRDAKSPGMGNLIKMWDTKTKEAPQSREPLQAIKQRSNTHQGETWKSVSMHKKQSVDENNSTHDSGSAFRNRASSIQFQSPKPYINRSSAKSYQHSESTGTLIVSTNDQTFAFDESAIHKYSANPEEENSSVQAKAPKPEETHSNVETRMTSQEILANADVAIYNIPSDSDSLEDNPGMNIATYEDFDETDSGVTSAVYAVADDVPYPPHHSASIRSLQGYLPMSGNVPDSMVEIRYERMSQEVHLPSSNYGSQVVPPPAVKPKSTPEYHEIDPNVPPPPDRDPPRLPPGIKPLVTSKSVDEDPPPLPPDNVVGRRSMMLTREKKKLIVKDLKDKVNSGTKKLNYVDVEISSNMGNNFVRSTQQPKTNYSDVVVLSESEIATRDRSGSGTSEEGLSSVPRNKNKKVKNKIQALFTSKENNNASPEKPAEKEQLTDFEKERNKKKRISGRFLRKKKTENDKNKKDQRNSDAAMRNTESDSGTFDLETTSSATSTNTSRSTSVVNTSSGGSAQSSGDGEVAVTSLHGDDRTVKWKVLPTASPEHRRWSNEPMSSPVMHPQYHKSSSNPQLLPEGIYQDTDEIEITPEPDRPKVTSFLHGANTTSTQGSETPPKPLPRQQSLPQVQLPQGNPPISPAPPRPPKSEAMKDFYSTEYEDGGEVPPPIPQRDESDYIHEASNIVPPSPYALDGTSKFLSSEPLYQIYRNRTMSHASSKRKNVERAKSVKHEEERKGELNFEDLGTSTLWRNIPEVMKSGAQDGMTPEELKLQQAQFEVITSQASYLRSMNILVTHFMEDWAMESCDVLPTADRHVLFSNIQTVRSVEQKFLQDLEKHFWKEFKLTKICELIAQYAKSDFDVYVRYIQNQTYQDRVLTKLQRSNGRFPEELARLESSPACNKLPLLSFLLLPMQRVTRLPLLVTAIVNSADAAGDMKALKRAKHALGVVNKLVKKCNEGARKMQQTEQLAEIASQLDYSQSVKMFALVSQSRNLVKKGEMMVTMTTESKKSGNRSKLWLFLFTDVLFIARKKSFMEAGNSTRYEVVNWSKRNLLYVNEYAVSENSIFLVILEDQAGKRSEVTLVPPSQNELSRWTDALNPPKLGSTEESIYETWDCPQYTCVEPYIAEQPDELSIDVNDVMQIYKKTSDGWLEGERMRDGEVGWFPANRCEEIEDEHVRARNMKNLYKLTT